jgi:hypothetical protein
VIKLPFEEAKTFFQNKLNIPTLKWDDLWKDQHAKGFMVAGAYKADLLADLRSAVDRVHSEGMTLDNFRREFGGIAHRRGWSYKGGRKWRSELIYNTNIRQSYNAGRWRQATDPELLEIMPYIRYRHGDSRVPRPQHLAWDGVTLPPDDPWWKTHAPKNGWGCTCYIENATRQEYAKARAAGKGEAPPSPIDPKTGAPVGIDKGWDYNVGEAQHLDAAAVLGNKMSQAWPTEIGSLAAQEIVPKMALNEKFQAWADRVLENKTPSGVIKTTGDEICAGYMTGNIMAGLKKLGVMPDTAAIAINDAEWLHLQHLDFDKKPPSARKAENILSAEEARNLPVLIDGKQAALWDDAGAALLYVFPSDRPDRRGKIVVRVNFNEKGRISNGYAPAGLSPKRICGSRIMWSWKGNYNRHGRTPSRSYAWHPFM